MAVQSKTKKILLEYSSQLSHNEFESSFVKGFYYVINTLQVVMTISGHVRIWMYALGAKTKFKAFVAYRVILIFLLLLFLNFQFNNSKFVLFLNFFFVWEIFIINFWMFLFRQSANPAYNNVKEDNIRLILLLFIQYGSTIISFAGIFTYLSTNTVEFSIVGSDDIFDSIYFSFVTITTLGYGDMVPKGTLTKALVLSELSLGLLFTLLFLNMLLSNFQFKWRN